MYQSKMVVSLKTKEGKIIREQGNEVSLPFGSEYSIFIKNLESRKAKIKVTIDGQDVLDDKSLLIDGNEIIELEGFLKENIAKNSFKFIEKTQEISDFRGDNIDDGLIRVEFWYEKEKPIIQKIKYEHTDFWGNPYYFNDTTIYCNTAIPKGLNNTHTTSTLDCRGVDCSLDSMSLSRGLSDFQPYNDNGITVKGSEVNQKFKYGYIDELEEQSHIIILKLKGYKENKEKVEKIVTVKDKLQCRTCGKVSKSDVKYCDRCGTYLE